MSKQMLNEKEAAEYIGMSRSYLRQDRMNGAIKHRTLGPTFFKLGRSVRYKIEDLEQWLEARRVKRAIPAGCQESLRFD